MFNNALILRYRYSSLRPQQFWVFASIYVLLIAALLLINISLFRYQQIFNNVEELYRSLYYQILTIQVLILLVWAAFNSGSAIGEEILNKSYDFFKMLPMPAHKKAIGILIGKNLPVLLLALVNLVLLVVLGTIGRVNTYLQLQFLLTVVTLATLVNLTSLLSSINRHPKQRSSRTLLIGLLALFVLPQLLMAVGGLSEIKNLQTFGVYFFTAKIPILLLITLIAIYFSCWLFKGIIRKFNHEGAPLFTRKGAILFAFGYEFVVIGLFYQYLPCRKYVFSEDEIIWSFWIVLLAPAILIYLGSLLSLENYLAISGLQPSRKSMTSFILPNSNIILAIILFAIWTIPAVGVTILNKKLLLPALSSILVLFSFYILLACLVEIYLLYKSQNSKIGLLIGFLVLLQVLLPLIMAGVTDLPFLSQYSPLGYIFRNFEQERDTAIDTTVYVFNLVVCLIPLILALKQYKTIVMVRQKM